MLDLSVDFTKYVKRSLRLKAIDEYTIPVIAWRTGGTTYNGLPLEGKCWIRRLVIPSVKSTYVDYFSYIVTDGDFVCEDITLQQFLKGVIDGDLDVVELLSTPYLSVNSDFANEFEDMILILNNLKVNEEKFLDNVYEQAKNCLEDCMYGEVLRLEGVVNACLGGQELKEWFTIQPNVLQRILFVDDKTKGRVKDDSQMAQDALDRMYHAIYEDTTKAFSIIAVEDLDELRELLYSLHLLVLRDEYC